MTRAAANDLAGTSGAQSGSCFGLSADNQPPPVANHFLKAASNLVSAAPANVTIYGKAFANQPLALGFAPLHDLGTIHVGRASAVNPTGNFAPLKRSNGCERQSVCWSLKS